MKNKNFKAEQDVFPKNAQCISKIYREVLLFMKFLQTKPQIKNMNNKFHDFYYTAIKNRNEFRDLDNQYEIDDNDYIVKNDFITLNHDIGIKTRETMIR